jgi:hypothetical protein
MGKQAKMEKTSGIYPEFSPSINEVIAILPRKEPISASKFAQEIIKKHSGYATQRANYLLPLDDTQQKRLVTEWLQEVQSLYNFEMVMKFSEKGPPYLHSRLLLTGLAFLEPGLPHVSPLRSISRRECILN